MRRSARTRESPPRPSSLFIVIWIRIVMYSLYSYVIYTVIVMYSLFRVILVVDVDHLAREVDDIPTRQTTIITIITNSSVISIIMYIYIYIYREREREIISNYSSKYYYYHHYIYIYIYTYTYRHIHFQQSTITASDSNQVYRILSHWCTWMNLSCGRALLRG